jgi:hypothetical protein
MLYFESELPIKINLALLVMNVLYLKMPKPVIHVDLENYVENIEKDNIVRGKELLRFLVRLLIS